MSGPDERADTVSAMAAVIEALEAAERFMVLRDEMNAAVHLAPVRLSPVTDLVRHGLEAAGQLRSALRAPNAATWGDGERAATDVR